MRGSRARAAYERIAIHRVGSVCETKFEASQHVIVTKNLNRSGDSITSPQSPWWILLKIPRVLGQFAGPKNVRPDRFGDARSRSHGCSIEYEYEYRCAEYEYELRVD